MDFKNWSKNKNKTENGDSATSSNAQQQRAQGDTNRKTGAAGNLEEKLGEYRNMSESDLQDELKRQVSRARDTENLSDADLSGFAEKVSPFLSDEQRNRLNNILKTLK